MFFRREGLVAGLAVTMHFIVTFSIFSFCRCSSFCTAAAVSTTALFLLCVTARLCFWSCN